MNDSKEIFAKEISDFALLIKCFNARYLDYKTSKLKHFIFFNPNELDIDNYDLYSSHFILTNIDNKILGYGRLITGTKTRFYDEILELCKRKNMFHVKKDFQFIRLICSYKEIPNELYSAVNNLNSKYSIIETGRLVILDKESGIKNTLILIKYAIAYSLTKADVIISSCLSRQYIMYEKYGFRFLPGGKNYSIRGITCSSLFLKNEMILAKYKQEIKKIVNRVDKK